MNRLYPNISIRTKIIVMAVGILVLSIIIAGYLIRGIVYKNIVSQKMTAVDLLTASLVHDVKHDFDVGYPEHTSDVIAKFMTYYRMIQGISFYDSNFINRADSNSENIGRVTDRPDIVNAITKAKPKIKITNEDWNNLTIRSIAPILQGSKIRGAVVMDISLNDIQATISAIDQNIILFLIFTITLTSITLFFLLRKTILDRLTKLIKLTRQIAEGNYDIQVNDDRKDEIGVLGRAFNQMTREIKNSKEEIDNYNRHLEQRIYDATSELQKAYEDIKNTQSQLVLNEKMASLGILIAGIAHEINTPVGAILNISRKLEDKVSSLPRSIEELNSVQDISLSRMTACLADLIQTNTSNQQTQSYKEMRFLESLLLQNGIVNAREMINRLSKLDYTDPGKIVNYLDCLRIPSFFALFESIGSIVIAARISETSSQKISEIVRALKYYAYTDKDSIEMIQVNESIQTALVLLRNRLKHKVNISTEFDADLPQIPCNCEIHQIWTNLLNNACDAIEEMGDDCQGEIIIKTFRKDNYIVVEVRDNGIGIPENQIEKVFDPFFTTKDIGKGTGLGLSIVTGILNKHNAKIGVKSRRGCTVFEICLPVVRHHDNEDNKIVHGHDIEGLDVELCHSVAGSSHSGDADAN